MSNDFNWGLSIVWISALLSCLGLGYYLGRIEGEARTTTRLTHEAVREHAGTWTAGEQGEPVFKWLACVPAKPQDLKGK